MGLKATNNDAVHWFMSELTSRIVAETGIPSDRFHLGKIILQSFKDAPEFIMQIDGATGETETFGSALRRTVKCASCFDKLGLKLGDVIVLMSPNHIHTAIPFYAALYRGIVVSAVDRTLGIKELEGSFSVTRPKMIFCQKDRATDVQIALNAIDLNAKIVSFDGGDYLCSFQEFMEKHGADAPSVKDFKPTEFDPANTIGFLIATSGTTGLPKAAAATQKNFAVTIPYIWLRHTTFPTPTKMVMIGSPLQWLTALMHFIMSPVFRFTRLQTSRALTKEHCYDLINNYKPTWTVFSPPFMTSLIKAADHGACDFGCLETILLAGSAVPMDLIVESQKKIPHADVFNVFGMSELTSVAFFKSDTSPADSCGARIGNLMYRLIDTSTGEDIDEPNKPGELWLKGPGIFKEYYRNPEATKETFAEDRWFKTGDLFYRDHLYNYYFVERIKLLLKYKSYQISPVELEAVIRQHPGVKDAAVTGLPDPEAGDLPVACVVLREGWQVTAREIKDMVKDNLSDAKQLRGGVIFLEELPLTASTKIHRRQIKEMVLHMERQ